MKANIRLQQTLIEIKEYNQLKDNDRVLRVAVSRDGKLIVSASRNDTIKILRNNGLLQQTLTHNDDVNDVKISPNGKFLASVSDDQTMIIWQVNQQGVYQVYKKIKYTEQMQSVNFSPDGNFIVSGSSNGMIIIITLSGQLIKEFKGHDESVFDITFSPDGKLIASASWDKTVKIWTKDGTLIQTLIGHKDQVDSANFSPDGKFLVTSGSNYDKTIKLWEFKNKKFILLKSINGHGNTIYSVQFSPDGTKIVSASKDETIKLWDKQGNLLEVFYGHTNSVNSANFTPDGKMIISGSGDNTLRFWFLKDDYHPNILTLDEDKNTGLNFKFNHQNNIVIMGKKLWDLSGNLIFSEKDIDPHPPTPTRTTGEGEKLDNHQVRKPSILPNGIDFNLKGELMALVRLENQQIAIFQENQGYKTINLPSKMMVSNVSFNHNKTLIAVAFTGKKDQGKYENVGINIYNINGDLIKNLSGHTDYIMSVNWSNDDKMLASASDDKTVKIWQTNNWILSKELKGHSDRVMSVNWSCDNQMLVTGSQDNTIKLWRSDGTLINTFSGHDRVINHVIFSPNCQFIISGSEDQTIKVWTLQGELLGTLKNKYPVNSVIFNEKENTLVTGGREGKVISYNLDLNLLKQQTCAYLKDYFLSHNPQEKTECK